MPRSGLSVDNFETVNLLDVDLLDVDLFGVNLFDAGLDEDEGFTGRTLS